MSQERQYIRVSMAGFDKHSATRDIAHFLGQIGIWSPVVVRNQEDKDYLVGMALLLGVDAAKHIHVGAPPEKTDSRMPTWVTHIDQIRSMIGI